MRAPAPPSPLPLLACAVVVAAAGFVACRTSSTSTHASGVDPADAHPIAANARPDPLAGRRVQLEKLNGQPVTSSAAGEWSARAVGVPGATGAVVEGAALGGLKGASLGDAGGVGGIGLRGVGVGGGGTGTGYGTSTGTGTGTVGRGSGSGSGKVSVSRVVVEKSEAGASVDGFEDHDGVPDSVDGPADADLVKAPSPIETGAVAPAHAPIVASPAPVTSSGVAGKARYDFSDVTIEGELVKPSGSYAKDRKVTRGPAAADQTPLKAGTTDDNADLAGFCEYEDNATKDAVPTGAMKIDVHERKLIEVVDGDGRALPTVELTIRDAKSEKIVATAETYGDGRAPFYPRVSLAPQHGPLLVEAQLGGKAVATSWDARADLKIRLDVARPAAEPLPIDVLFIIDTTGSMGDEIERVKSTLLATTAKVRQLGRVDLRYGAVLYRDVGDEYVTSVHDFSSDIAGFDKALQSVVADGGGDTPESLNQGLSEGMVGVHWRDRAAKVAFLIADAPPHMDYEDDVAYGESLKDAVTLGVRIHAVAASGLADDPAGSLVFRQIAQYARGKFIFIEYGGDVAKSAEAHGVSGVTTSNNLDDILFTEIKDEVTGWGRS